MIQLDALKKRPERQTNKQTEPQKLTCRSSANFVSAGQKKVKKNVGKNYHFPRWGGLGAVGTTKKIIFLTLPLLGS